METRRRTIIYTVIIGLLVWAICSTAVILLTRQLNQPAGLGYKEITIILSTFIVVFIASLIVGTMLSKRTKSRQDLEKLLQEIEEGFHTLSETSSEGIFIHDGLNIIEVNEAGAKMAGCEPSEIRGCPLTDFIPAEFLKLALDRMQKKYDKPYEIELRRKDGTSFPAEVHGRDIIHEGKKIRVVYIRDLTNREKTKGEMQSQNELLDASTDSIFVHDFNGKLLYVNKTACQAHGYTRDELLSINLNNLGISDYRRLIKPEGGQAGHQDTTIYETIHLRKDKTVLPLEIHARVFRWKNKECILSIARDITERKKAEGLLENIALNSPAGIYIVQDGKFQFVNPQFIKGTGYT
ncbi:MAG: PAS domain S-box protein, partial [Dehalococcoidales bacterium]|nr:PAS domain S-box protein [Dehalococcoidales bacterium]